MVAEITALLIATAVMVHAADLKWSKLSAIPDPEGFAGAFAGVSNGALIAGGGANIPHDRWATTFTKAWYDDIYLLERMDGAWRKVGKLPNALGYGVSITTDAGIVCAGGADSKHHLTDVFMLTWNGTELRRTSLPSLPKPCAMMCGALVGASVYIAGGIEQPNSTTALKTLWALELNDAQAGWRELEPCPGPERMLAVASSLDGAFYLFSGARLSAGPDGKAVREYLRDAWRYRVGEGWAQLPMLPRPAVAAPSPAPAASHRVYLFSGDDGLNVNFTPLPEHPGFPRDTLVFDSTANEWLVERGLPFSRATAPVARWSDHYVIFNGEVRPRVRTPEVWGVLLP